VDTTSFEADLGAWTVAGPPPGTGLNATDWFRTQRQYEVAAAVTTEDTIYLGFGLEGVNGAGTRAAVMGRAMEYLEP
jgi:hypothetical protein